MLHIVAAFKHRDKVIILDESGAMWEIKIPTIDMPEIRRLGFIPHSLMQLMEE